MQQARIHSTEEVNRKRKTSENLFRILTETIVSEKKFKQFKKSLRTFIKSEAYETNVVVENAENLFKDSNLIILCCDFGQQIVLEYVLSHGKQFLDALSSLTETNLSYPLVEDGVCHNAFYYAIRSNNVGIVELLLTKWLPSCDAPVPSKHSLLSAAYEELKLRNVKLTEFMEFFVEGEILASRFKPICHNVDYVCLPNLENDLQKRVQLLLNNIDSLKTVDQESKFLVLAKCIAQTVHILKQQLKATYDTLPWEELQFCLITYIGSRINPQEKSLLPLMAIDKKTLISQSSYFASILKTLNVSSLGRNELPNMSREEVISRIKKNSPEFNSLFEIYAKTRDIYSLEELAEKLEIDLSGKYQGPISKFAVMRVLQILSYYLQNTLGNCKLSDATSRVILSALQKNTRNLVIQLRNCTSEADFLKKSLEIEKESARFFPKTVNELDVLYCFLTRILTKQKLKILVKLLRKITESDNVAEVCEILKSVKLVMKDIDSENFIFYQEYAICTSFGELYRAITIPGIKLNEFLLLKDVMSSFRREHMKGVRTIMMNCLDKLKGYDSGRDVSDLTAIKQTAEVVLNCLLAKTFVDKMAKVQELVRQVDKLKSRLNFSKSDEEDIEWLLFEISFKAATDVEDIYCVDMSQSVIDPVENSNPFWTKKMRRKILSDKTFALEFLMTEWDVKNPNFLKKNGKLRLATEFLLSDIVSIMEIDESCVQDTLVLPGEDLKNYLSHRNELIAIFSTDCVTAILSSAIVFLKGRPKIRKEFCSDLSEIKNKLRRDLEIVTTQDQLFRAFEEGDTETSLKLIKSGADLLGRNINDESALHFTARSQNIDLLKFILEQNVNANSANKRGRTALHVASALGNIPVVEHLLNMANADVNKKDENGQTALHLAAKNAEIETVKLLIKFGADMSIKDLNLRTPLFLAIENNNAGVVETLLDHGAHMNGSEVIGRFTPLHIAVEYRRVDIIKLLLQKGLDVDVNNDLDSTPLIEAARNGYVEAVEVLIQAGANVNAHSASGFTALHFATDRDRTAMAAILLQNGADANPAKNPDELDLPIHFAAEKGQSEVVQLLIEHKADVNRRNSKHLAPLHLAAERGHLNVVQALINAGVDIQSKGDRGFTALDHSVFNGRLETTKLLLEKGARMNEVFPSVYYLTVLNIAAEKGYEEIGKILVHNGAEIDIATKDGSTPLYLATKIGANSLVELLLERGANPDAKNDCGLAPVHMGSIYGNVEGVSYLIRYKCNVNAEGPFGMTPLHMAATAGNCEVAEVLLKNGADVNSTCHRRLTPLFAAVENNHLDLVKLFVRYGAKISLGVILPVQQAVDDGSKDILEYLVQQGAKADQLFKNICPDSPYFDIMFLFYPEKQNDVIVAAIKGDLLSLKELLKTRDHHYDCEKSAALYFAVDRVDVKCVQLLLQHGVDASQSHFSRKGTRTALLTAVNKQSVPIVKMLLELAPNNGKTDFIDNTAYGNTPLHVAAYHGNLILVKMLLTYGAIYEVKNFEDATPKDLSSNVEVVRFFDLLSQMFADAETGNIRVVRLIKSVKKEDVCVFAGAKNYQRRTIIDVAVYFKHNDIAKELMKIIEASKAK